MTREDKTQEFITVASEYEDGSAATLVLSHVETLTRKKVNEYAAAYVLQMVRTERRRRVAAIEQAAFEQRQARIKADYNRPEAVSKRTEIDRAYAERQKVANTEFFQDISAKLEGYAKTMHVRWTAELLEAKFARSDGTTIAWGEASRADHEDRAAMHTKHAVTGLEGASRHLAAIELMNKTGAVSLNDAVAVSA